MKLGVRIFILGMITAFCIVGAFGVLDLEPAMKVILPQWVYIIGILLSIILAGVWVGEMESKRVSSIQK
jgi:hypothetical protein